MGTHRTGKDGRLREDREVVPEFRRSLPFHHPGGPDTTHSSQSRPDRQAGKQGQVRTQPGLPFFYPPIVLGNWYFSISVRLLPKPPPVYSLA
jgi:hypothetical protein